MVHAGIPAGTWDVTDIGIVFVRHTGSEGAAPRDRAPDGTTRRLMASRDGTTVIVSHVDRWERDIMVLDNFR